MHELYAQKIKRRKKVGMEINFENLSTEKEAKILETEEVLEIRGYQNQRYLKFTIFTNVNT